MEPSRPKSEVFARYDTLPMQMVFKKHEETIIAEKITEGKPPIEYPLDPSCYTMQIVPVQCKQSKMTIIVWLLNNDFVPSIKNRKVTFIKNESSQLTVDKTSSVESIVSKPLQGRRLPDSPLHIAAGQGNITTVKSLIGQSVCLDIQDSSKRTPLYIATVQNQMEVVRCLLDHGADPTICAIEGDTILHVAAFYGHASLLNMLLDDAKTAQLLHCKDSDGKQPIHKAAMGNSNSEITRMLLARGASANAVSAFNYSPLHWATKNGHRETVRVLLENDAQYDILNENAQTAFDFALQYGHDDILSLFLCHPSESIIDNRAAIFADSIPSFVPYSNDSDHVAHYSSCLLKAKKEENIFGQVLALFKLSDYYVELSQSQQDNPTSQHNTLLRAAKLLNAAIAILENANLQDTHFEDSLLRRLEKIEQFFVSNHAGKKLNRCRYLKTDRQWIRTSRIRCKSEIQEPFKAVSVMTKACKKLLAEFIVEAESLFGRAPVSWAAFCMGSMAREEMCPYSDIEFGFLIEESSVESIEYFRTISKFLQLRIINMGETVFPVFGEEGPSPTPDGFCMDTAGNTPLGVEGWYELICTPDQLLQFQSTKWMNENIILTNTLNCVGFVAGNSKLVEMYEKKLFHANTHFPFTEKEVPFREILSLKLLKDHLKEFAPDLSYEKEKLKAFGVKKELYRPIQEILSCLAMYYQVDAKGCSEKIDALTKLGIFSKEGGENLKKTVGYVLWLRLRAHFFYQNETEYLFQKDLGKSQDPVKVYTNSELRLMSHLYHQFGKDFLEESEEPDNSRKLYLDEEMKGYLQAIYRVIIPFHSCLLEFLNTQKKETLCNSSFFDRSSSSQGEAFQDDLQFDQALVAFQQAMSLDSYDLNSFQKLVQLLGVMGDAKKKLLRAKQLLEISIKLYGEKHFLTANTYKSIGSSLNSLGNSKEALEFFQKCLDVEREYYGTEQCTEIGVTYNNIGTALFCLGKVEESLTQFHKSLQIHSALCEESESNDQCVTGYINIGNALKELGRNIEALKYFKNAVSILIKAHGENHPDVARCYSGIGEVLKVIIGPEDALEYYQKALTIHLSIFKENHPDVATTYMNIGGCLVSLGNYQKALDHLESCLKIRLDLYGEQHPHVARCYSGMGVSLVHLGRAQEAFDIINKALHIIMDTYGNTHSEIAGIYANLGFACHFLERFKEALEYYDKALSLFPSEDVYMQGSTWGNRGASHEKLRNKQEAIFAFQKSLEILLPIYGPDHEEIRGIKSRLQRLNSGENLDNKDPKETLHFLESSLKTQIGLYGENHPKIAEVYTKMGSCCLQSNQGIEQALSYFTKAYLIQTKCYGKKHATIATSYYNMATCYITSIRAGSSDSKTKKSAISFLKEALKIYIKLHTKYHSDVAKCYLSIGEVKLLTGSYIYAYAHSKEALKIYIRLHGEQHLDVGKSYYSVASAYLHGKKYKKSIRYFQNAVTVFSNILGETHPDLTTLYDSMGIAYYALGEYKIALEMTQKALDILLLSYDSTHPEVRQMQSHIETIKSRNGAF